ncbi:hypothetical protein FA15DRAFT_737336 [Coprinopsis marcescibilis]|uniref:Uncharacterized protein n=1 Tax=Coprinopsis marcescibilis TaxID=230819 RepID=A0A5C3KAL4_COPMA|nr:hypothetical protein FA15DRAFT_737336 [Coprinopsis marcescibilis]
MRNRAPGPSLDNPINPAHANHNAHVNAVIDGVKESARSKRGKSKIEVISIYMLAARSIPSRVSPFMDYTVVLRSKLPQACATEDDRVNFERIAAVMPGSFKKTLRAMWAKDQTTTETFINYIASDAHDNRSHDFAILRQNIIFWINPEPLTPLTPPLLPTSSMACRGWYHNEFSYHHIPRDHNDDFLDDPDEYRRSVITQERIITVSPTLPIALYDPETRYNPDLPHIGLFKGYLFHRCIRAFLTGPSTAFGDKRTGKTPPKAWLYGITRIDRYIIAYVCVGMMFSLSSLSEWSQDHKYLDFDYEELYSEVVAILEADPDFENEISDELDELVPQLRRAVPRQRCQATTVRASDRVLEGRRRMLGQAQTNRTQEQTRPRPELDERRSRPAPDMVRTRPPLDEHLHRPRLQPGSNGHRSQPPDEYRPRPHVQPEPDSHGSRPILEERRPRPRVQPESENHHSRPVSDQRHPRSQAESNHHRSQPVSDEHRIQPGSDERRPRPRPRPQPTSDDQHFQPIPDERRTRPPSDEPRHHSQPFSDKERPGPSSSERRPQPLPRRRAPLHQIPIPEICHSKEVEDESDESDEFEEVDELEDDEEGGPKNLRAATEDITMQAPIETDYVYPLDDNNWPRDSATPGPHVDNHGDLGDDFYTDDFNASRDPSTSAANRDDMPEARHNFRAMVELNGYASGDTDEELDLSNGLQSLRKRPIKEAQALPPAVRKKRARYTPAPTDRRTRSQSRGLESRAGSLGTRSGSFLNATDE